MATSSAKIFIGDDTTDGRSLIHKMKSKGPNIEPCGTPERTGDQSEAHPFINTRCCLVVRNEENHFSMDPPTP